jgi:hypothetical protein
MDFLDVFSVLPVDLPGSPSSRRSPRENLVGMVCLTLFPVIDFFIVLFGELYDRPALAGIVLPAAFGVASVAICRVLRIAGGWTAVVSLGCFALCLAASMAALLLGLFVSFFTYF